MFSEYKNKKGSIMLITFLIMSSVMVIAMGASTLVVSAIRMGGTQARAAKAFFAAEAGAERVMWELRKNAFNYTKCDDESYFVNFTDDPTHAICDNTGPHLMPLTNSAQFQVASSTQTSTTVFKSIGSYSGTNRVVELSF